MKWTFTSPAGHEVRIDYVALPQHLDFVKVSTWVDDDIDLTLLRCEHYASLCKVQLRIPTRPQKQNPRSFAPDVADLAYQLQDRENLYHLHHMMPSLSWHMDPHTSAEQLLASAHATVQQLAQPRTKWRRKSRISKATWALVTS